MDLVDLSKYLPLRLKSSILDNVKSVQKLISLSTTYNLSLTTNLGFTLIEMLIVISVFVILSTGAVINYRAFSRRQQIIQSVQNIQETFRIAQKKARAGEKPAGCQTLNGYIVSGTTNSTTLNVTADCTNQDYQVTRGQLVGSARLQSNISMTFRVITGGVTGSGEVRTVLGNYEYAFTVDEAGGITEGSYE